METDSAMDLSLRNTVSSEAPSPVPIVRPIPRPPWSILWYQNLWSLSRPGENTSGEGGGSWGHYGSPILNCMASSTNTSEHSFGEYNSPLVTTHGNRHLFRLSLSTNSLASSSYNCSNEDDDNPRTKECEERKSLEQVVNMQEDEENRVCSSGEDNDENECERMVITSDNAPGNSSNNDSSSSPRSLHPSPEEPDSLSFGPQVILDIACCDGPVQFKRISNPNFAVTVEHNDDGKSSSTTSTTTVMGIRKETNEPKKYSHHRSTTPPATSLKTYLCIYCNQNFKSLFCYQKHKKRHLNPVSVDITTTTRNPSTPRGGTSGGSCDGGRDHRRGLPTTSTSSTTPITLFPDNTQAKTKDLNVQFFPCKKCGCKFPSYYFVHKHRKVCH